MKRTLLTAITVAICLPAAAAQRDYAFDGNISRDVLENYLSRAITYAELLNGDLVEKQLHGSTDDNIRMLKNVGAKFAGRAIYLWGGESRLEGLLEGAVPIVQKLRAADPDIKILSSFLTDEMLAKGGDYLDYLCPHHYACADLAGAEASFLALEEQIRLAASPRPVRTLSAPVTPRK